MATRFSGLTPEQVSAEQRRLTMIRHQNAKLWILDNTLAAAVYITGQIEDETLDPTTRARAATAVLDRGGIGPGSSVRVEEGPSAATEVQMQVLLESATPAELDCIAAAQATMQRIAERVARGEAAPKLGSGSVSNREGLAKAGGVE